MEKLHQLWLKLIDIVFWQTLISHFRWVDWVTVVFVVIGLFYGMRKGLMRELVELFEMIVILAVTFACQPMVVAFLKSYLTSVSEKSLAPIAFMVTALCAWFVVSVIDKYGQKWIHAKLTGFFKWAGGGALGVIQFFLIWSFISQAILLMPIRGAQQIYDAGNSSMGPKVKAFAPAVYQTLSNPGQILPKRT